MRRADGRATLSDVEGLAVARMVLGTAFLVAPRLSLTAGLLDARAPQAPYLGRLFASREIALGAATLLAPPAQRPAMVRLGLAVDVSDTAAALLAVRGGGVTRGRGAVLAAASLAAVAGGLGALRRR